ncbi:MAG: hypothetical protein GOU97_04865 [Nanoarchaeota archaeon]|nr:hypothetical protein [Nanoarchaeota archaeon]
MRVDSKEYLERFVIRDEQGSIESVVWEEFYEKNKRGTQTEGHFIDFLVDESILSFKEKGNYSISRGSVFVGPRSPHGPGLQLYFTIREFAEKFVEQVPYIRGFDAGTMIWKNEGSFQKRYPKGTLSQKQLGVK